jgi:hypothetical protein
MGGLESRRRLRFSGGNVNAHWVLTSNWSFGTGFNMNTLRASTIDSRAEVPADSARVD